MLTGNKHMQFEFQYHGYLYYLYTQAMSMATSPNYFPKVGC